MNIKKPGFFLTILLGIAFIINSCKKENQGVDAFLVGGHWELASVQVYHFVGSPLISTDTLNTDCNLIQEFTFNSDKTCTYTNFDCKAQPVAKGHWALSSNQLFLNSDIVCQDTTAAGSSKPFANARIVNLGSYSFVIQTGDLQSYYQANTKRRIVQYGFVRQK